MTIETLTEINTATVTTSVYKAEHPFKEMVRMFFRNKTAIFGLVLLTIILLIVLVGPSLYGIKPFDIVGAPMSPPLENGFWLGTDYLGRDMLSIVIHGGQPTLAVGLTAASFTIVIGLIIGSLSGFYGSRIDNALMRVTEFFQVLPPLVFAMVLVTLFSPSLITIAFAIGVVSWPGMARLSRSEFLKFRDQEFIMAARVIGAKNRRIIWRIILPNAMPPLIVTSTLTIGVAILFEAGLSFLGLGNPNIMSWGYIIGASRIYIFECWWGVTFPGIAIFLTVLAVSLIGDGLNDAFNPKLRQL